MDFALTDDQQTVRDLAARLLSDHCTPEALRACEDSDSAGFDRALWAKLAEAGLLGVCIPEEHGGLGLGLVELAVLLEEAGRTAAPVPLLAGLALGALTVVRHGSAQQQGYLLPAIAAGSTLVTAALVEPLGDELAPATTARPEGDRWVLDGTKTCVPAGLYADQLIVSATTPDGPRLFFVNPTGPGVTRETQDTISYVPEALVLLDGAEGWPLGDATALKDVVEVGTAATCALLAGVAAQAVRLTADYTKTREQFGHPIAHFQAVGQRAADAFIDTTTIRLTMLQAVWLLAQRLPADKEVAVAKYFGSDAGQRVVRAAAHLHGGMGVSREYPLHRYYLAAKQYELTLGGGTRQLAKLGRLLADEPV
ncbi:MAG: acyl-CoA dehydrogenase family protein [Mycobacteriales bacterium]